MKLFKRITDAEENRAHCDYTQISYYYVVDTACDTLHPALTETEVENQTTVAWHSLDEAYRLSASPVHTNPKKKYLQARDPHSHGHRYAKPQFK